jgi:hypothetical protein
MQKLEDRIDMLDNKLDAMRDEVTVRLTRIEAAQMPRSEIYSEDSKRVLVETYNQAHQALLDRITKLESGPQRFLGYLGAATGCLSACFVILGIIASIIIALVPGH